MSKFRKSAFGLSGGGVRAVLQFQSNHTEGRLKEIIQSSAQFHGCTNCVGKEQAVKAMLLRVSALHLEVA